MYSPFVTYRRSRKTIGKITVRKRNEMFSEQKLAFLHTQPLARLATVAVSGQPDADAIRFAFENGRFSIAGYDLDRTRKYKNIAVGHSKVSLLQSPLQSSWVMPAHPSECQTMSMDRNGLI